MRGGPDGYEMSFQLSGADGPVGLELSAVSQREPVLHGGNGLVEMGAGGRCNVLLLPIPGSPYPVG